MKPYYTPYTNLGNQGVSSLSSLLGSGYLTNQFGSQDLNANLSPNYAFQLQQGQQAQNAASNATGGLVSGNAQQALQNYTQNYAQNAYQNAFNNYQAQRGNILSGLSGIANIGQNAVSGLGNLSTGTAQGVASLGVGAANAQAAGQVGAANAYSGAAQNAGNMAYLGSLLNQNQGLGGSTSNTYANMGLVGNNATGYTYSPAAEVGPTYAQLGVA